jgi:hypothetical protein
VEPEYPVSSIADASPSSGSAEEAPPAVLVPLQEEEPPAAFGDAAGNPPPQVKQTLPPVIGEEDPAPSPPAEETQASDPTPTLSPKPTRAPGGNPEKYPVFPSRRLHLKGDPEAQAPRAGVKIWPAEPGSSLLNRMLNGGE